MAPKTLDDLFYDMLRDIYYAERKILKALPKMARSAQSEALSAAFLTHRDETEVHIERLQSLFEALGRAARAKTCPAIDGIIEEAEEVMEGFKDSPALDAGLVAAAQAVEHYEIARYGTLRSWAAMMERDDLVALLQQSLDEEERTDEALSALAHDGINRAALAA